MKQHKIDDQELERVSGAGPITSKGKQDQISGVGVGEGSGGGGGNTGIDLDNEGSGGNSSLGQD